MELMDFVLMLQNQFPMHMPRWSIMPQTVTPWAKFTMVTLDMHVCTNVTVSTDSSTSPSTSRSFPSSPPPEPPNEILNKISAHNPLIMNSLYFIIYKLLVLIIACLGILFH